MDVRIIKGVRNYVKLFFEHSFEVCTETVDFGQVNRQGGADLLIGPDQLKFDLHRHH